ncbi:MAG: hypothetical protein AAF799_47335 [Myxococcota bacterium]
MAPLMLLVGCENTDRDSQPQPGTTTFTTALASSADDEMTAADDASDTDDSGADDATSANSATGLDDGTDEGPTGGGTGPDPETILFEEDFEGAGEGTVPAGWDSFVGYVVNMNNDPGGMAFALADGSRPRQGERSLHVVGGQTPAMLTRPFPPGVDRVYVRTYVWLTEKLGANPGNNHETLLGVRASVGQANDEVRFGEIKGVIGTNEVPSDDISPTMESWDRGPEITAGAWHCVEVAFLADQANHEVRAWSDGVEVHVVNDPSQWNNGALGEQFLADKFNEFIIGWHSFSNFDNELWFDDVVVATERVGCN